jgi:hypothetical protein
VQRFEAEARTLAWLPDVAPRAPVAPPMPRMDLVQAYDECMLSYSESRRVLLPTETAVDRPLTPSENLAVDGAVARFGSFLGLPATWR